MTRISTEQLLANASGMQRAGRLQQAETIYRQVLTVEPENPTALYLLGALARQVGQLDAAAELVSRAVAFSPATPPFHLELARIFESLNRIDECESHLKV